jgi:hypothetical protein
MILFYIVLLIINFVLLLKSELLDANTDVSNYPRIIRIYKNTDKLKHFPKKIPDDAGYVNFEEWPQFLQGGGGVYLSYNIDENKEKEIDKEFEKKSKYIINSLEATSNKNPNIYITPKMEQALGHSNNFTIYMLEAKNLSDNESWNHGNEYGIISNRSTYRIIYFAEYW